MKIKIARFEFCYGSFCLSKYLPISSRNYNSQNVGARLKQTDGNRWLFFLKKGKSLASFFVNFRRFKQTLTFLIKKYK